MGWYREAEQMRNPWFLILILLLTGCAPGGISTGSLNSIITGTTAAGDDIVEASIANQAIVHSTLKNRDDRYAEAYALSGFKIDFKLYHINGTPAFLPTSITYKPEPQFTTPLPTKPSDHAFWDFGKSAIGLLAKYGFYGFVAHEIAGVWESSIESAQGTTYSGTLFNSGNTLRGGTSTFGGPGDTTMGLDLSSETSTETILTQPE